MHNGYKLCPHVCNCTRNTYCRSKGINHYYSCMRVQKGKHPILQWCMLPDLPTLLIVSMIFHPQGLNQPQALLPHRKIEQGILGIALE